MENIVRRKMWKSMNVQSNDYNTICNKWFLWTALWKGNVLRNCYSSINIWSRQTAIEWKMIMWFRCLLTSYPTFTLHVIKWMGFDSILLFSCFPKTECHILILFLQQENNTAGKYCVTNNLQLFPIRQIFQSINLL